MSLFDQLKSILDGSNSDEEQEITLPDEEYNEFVAKFIRSHSETELVDDKPVKVAGEVELISGFDVSVSNVDEPVQYEVYPNRKREEIVNQGTIENNDGLEITEDVTITSVIVFSQGEVELGEYAAGSEATDIKTKRGGIVHIEDVIETYVEPFMGEWGRNLIKDEITSDEQNIHLGYTRDKSRTKRIDPAKFEVGKLDKHLYTSGQTGMGKSTLIINILLQLSLYGNNFVMVTPKADDTLKTLQTLDENELEKTDVLKAGNVDAENSVSYNLFDTSDMTPTEQEKFIEDRVATFVAMMTSKFGTGGIIEPVAKTVGRSMMLSDDPYSMADFVRVIIDDDYREEFVDEMKKELESPPSYLDNLKSMDSDDELDALSRRIKDFDESNALKQLTYSQDSDINFKDYVSGDRNLVVDLELLSPDEKAIIGIMVLRELWVAAKMRREKTLEKNRDMVVTVIDEVQDVITSNNFEQSRIQTILQKARAYQLGLITASQSPDQLNNKFRNELRTNSEVKIPLYNETGANFYSNAFNSVAGVSVNSSDLAKLKPYQSYLQKSPTDKPIKVDNYPLYPPKISERKIRKVKENLINRTGSERAKSGKISDYTLLGDRDDDFEVSESKQSEEEKATTVARAIDIAQRYYAFQNNRYNNEYDDEKCKYVPIELGEEVLEALGITYDYKDFAHYLEQNGFYFEMKRTDDGIYVGLTEKGEEFAATQSSGGSASGGGAKHRQILLEVRKELAKYGVAVEVPEQEGEMSDAIGYKFKETDNKAINRLFNDLSPDTTYLEAETSTGVYNPAQTLRNLAKVIDKGLKAVFIFPEESQAETNEKRLLDNQGYNKIYDTGEKLLYTGSNSEWLKKTTVTGTDKFPVRPRGEASTSTMWVKQPNEDTYILKDNKQNKHATLSFKDFVNDDWELSDFPAHYYKKDGVYIVKQDGQIVDRYDSKDEMKREWMYIKRPTMPKELFADTGLPEQHHFAQIVIEDAEWDEEQSEFKDEELYIYEDGERYYPEDYEETQDTSEEQEDKVDEETESKNSKTESISKPTIGDDENEEDDWTDDYTDEDNKTEENEEDEEEDIDDDFLDF